jgi:hypothetical protein
MPEVWSEHSTITRPPVAIFVAQRKYQEIMNNHKITFKPDLMVIKDVANFLFFPIDRDIARWYNSTIDNELLEGAS